MNTTNITEMIDSLRHTLNNLKDDLDKLERLKAFDSDESVRQFCLHAYDGRIKDALKIYAGGAPEGELYITNTSDDPRENEQIFVIGDSDKESVTFNLSYFIDEVSLIKIKFIQYYRSVELIKDECTKTRMRKRLDQSQSLEVLKVLNDYNITKYNESPVSELLVYSE